MSKVVKTMCSKKHTGWWPPKNTKNVVMLKRKAKKNWLIWYSTCHYHPFVKVSSQTMTFAFASHDPRWLFCSLQKNFKALCKNDRPLWFIPSKVFWTLQINLPNIIICTSSSRSTLFFLYHFSRAFSCAFQYFRPCCFYYLALFWKVKEFLAWQSSRGNSSENSPTFCIGFMCFCRKLFLVVCFVSLRCYEIE